MNLRGCISIIGVGSLLLGLLLLLGVLFGYDPTGVSGQLATNLFLLVLLLVGFWGLGVVLLYAANKMKK